MSKVAFGWLPNKEALSYHIFFLLLLGEFRYRAEEIKRRYGKNKLRLRKLKLDFEVAMHVSLSPLFILEGKFKSLHIPDTLIFVLGCMFHFSQAVYRKVQGAGLATAYLYEVSFTKFVRILCAISFLPLNEVAITVEELADYVFADIKSPDLLAKLDSFKIQVLEYFRTYWINGPFNPKAQLTS